MKLFTFKLQTSIIAVVMLMVTFQSGALFSKEKGVAKVIIMKGKVKAKDPATGSVISLKRGTWLSEGSIIQTAPRSFCKLLFIDKSQMSLGPKSKMIIEKFPKKKAGIINLLQGQLRSKVTKNYMDMDDKNKSKLFIKTRTAAMGIRGTDFQVNFNPANSVTSLVTFSGAVAMAKLDELVKHGVLNQNRLERIVSSPKAVMVKRGQYSGVDRKAKKVSKPIRISPAQLQSLKKSTNSIKQIETSRRKVKVKKKFRSPIPPGVSNKTFANRNQDLEKDVSKVVTKEVVKTALDNIIKPDSHLPEEMAPAESLPQESVPGETVQAAGGYIDLKTALYIPPPPGSTFDANTGVYTPTLEVGSFDPVTGGYLPPAGTVLSDAGTFEKDLNYIAPTDLTRSPASVDGVNSLPVEAILPTLAVALPGDVNTDETVEMDINLDALATRDPAADGEDLIDQEFIDGAVLDSKWDYENTIDLPTSTGKTSVQININTPIIP